MSVDLEENDKRSKWAIGCGGAMTIAFFVAAVAIWTLPIATEGRVSGGSLGQPFTGTGSVLLMLFGMLIAGIGILALVRGRRGRAPEKPWRSPPGPPRRTPAEAP